PRALSRARSGGAPHQRVLDDAVLDVAAAQLAAQVLDLGDGQAAIVGEDRDLRALHLFSQELDLLGLLLLARSGQMKNPPHPNDKRQEGSGTCPSLSGASV